MISRSDSPGPNDLLALVGDDHVLQRRADRLAAASGAVHVAGPDPAEIGEALNITLLPLSDDQLARPAGLTPWEPWPFKLAGSVFLLKLRELTCSESTPDQPARLDAALTRCREFEALADASARLPDKQQRKYHASKGSLFTDSWVSATADNGLEMAEGVVVGGERGEEGEWLLDQPFMIFTPDEQLIRCVGNNCHVVVE